MLQWTFQLSKNLRILQLRWQCVPWNWLLMTTLKELMFVNCYKYAFVCKECCIFQTCNIHLDQNVLQSHSFFYVEQNEIKTFRYPLKRQLGTKTFRNPLKKTVRHQESSVSGQICTAFSFKQTDYLFFKIKSTKVKKKTSMIV